MGQRLGSSANTCRLRSHSRTFGALLAAFAFSSAIPDSWPRFIFAETLPSNPVRAHSSCSSYSRSVRLRADAGLLRRTDSVRADSRWVRLGAHSGRSHSWWVRRWNSGDDAGCGLPSAPRAARDDRPLRLDAPEPQGDVLGAVPKRSSARVWCVSIPPSHSFIFGADKSSGSAGVIIVSEGGISTVKLDSTRDQVMGVPASVLSATKPNKAGQVVLGTRVFLLCPSASVVDLFVLPVSSDRRRASRADVHDHLEGRERVDGRHTWGACGPRCWAAWVEGVRSGV